MRRAGVTRPMDVVVLLLTWVLLYGPFGAVMYLVTTFLFAFSGGQYRMVPVVQRGFWVVGLVVLLVGGIALARTRSLTRAVGLMLASAVAAWLLAIGVYWLVSFRLGAIAPTVDTFGSSASGFPVEASAEAAAAGYRAGYGNGYYAILVPASGTDSRANGYSVTLEGRSFQNFALTVDVHWAAAVGQGAYGVVFRDGQKGGYRVLVDATGYVRMIKVVNDTTTIIRDWERVSSYRSGTQPNRIVITCNGSNISVLLNGATVATFVDTDLRVGEAGMAAWAWGEPVEARFVYFLVALAPP